jgi:hypothetical protein
MFKVPEKRKRKKVYFNFGNRQHLVPSLNYQLRSKVSDETDLLIANLSDEMLNLWSIWKT